VRYVSPALDSDRRALVVEAVVPNPGGALKPGLFATARLEQVKPSPGVVVPAAAVQTTGGTSRVFVVSGDHVEERVVTVGERVNAMIELTTGLKPGERVATSRVAELKDGTLVTPQSATPNP
jgi:multidrug efflux pump subunit AcrA (membrane-fusion protein)